MRIYQPTNQQASRIIAKFGGVEHLVRALKLVPNAGRHRSVVYKWLKPRTEGGTGGLIPLHALPGVVEAARLQGILITPSDLFDQVLPAPKPWFKKRRPYSLKDVW